jgi:hypothetical protein
MITMSSGRDETLLYGEGEGIISQEKGDNDMEKSS